MPEELISGLGRIIENSWYNTPRHPEQDVSVLFRDLAKAALDYIGVSPEVLDALRAGTWKAVPMEATDIMLDGPNSNSFMSQEQWKWALASTPEKPE